MWNRLGEGWRSEREHAGGSGRSIAPAVFGSLGAGPHLTLFLHRLVPRWGCRAPDRYTHGSAATRSPPPEFPQVNSEEDLPAEPPPPREAPRIPQAHAHPGRPGDPRPSPGEGAHAAVGLSAQLPAGLARTSVRPGRSLRPSEIRAVLAGGRRASGPRVILYVAPGEPGARPAFVAGRRIGGAVIRNRARRILRAAWRSLAPLVPEDERVVVVARGGISGATAKELETEMRGLLQRLGVLR